MALREQRRPKFSKKDAVLSESESEDELGSILNKNFKKKTNKNEEDISSISFGALNNAQRKLQKTSKQQAPSSSSEEENSSEEGGFFEEEESSDEENQRPSSSKSSKKKSKHAPSEVSAKKRVPKVRDIPGLTSKKDSTLYTDIRFDTAFGAADLEKTRKNYAFLDEYRKKEIQEMQDLLKANQKKQLLSESEVGELNYKIQSLKSRMDTLKNRDLEKKVIKDFKNKHKGSGNLYLKNSDKRKLIQKAKFDGMKSKQREKVMERKRKKRLGKEFKQMEFM